MINIALIGYGYWGPNVARNIYKNPNFNFLTICDKDEKRLSKAKSQYAFSINYETDSTKVIDDPNLDAIALAIETSSHYKLCKQALLAGKHVYIEKPFTDNVKDAIELRDLAQELKLKIHIDHIMVYHPAIQLIKKYYDSGALGDIIYFDCSRLNLGQVKNDVNSMWDLGVHDLSIIDYISNGSSANEIQVMGSKIYSAKESVTFLLLKYNDFLASIRSSWVSPIKERKIILAGTKKMLVYNDVELINKLIIYDKGFDISSDCEYEEYVAKARVGDAIIPYFSGGADALYNSLEYFRNCIINDQQSISNADAGIRIIKILEQADKKLR